MQHIHYGILKSFLNSGFDSTRPQIGICVQFKSAEGKRKLLDHNLRFTTGSQLLPRIEETKALYGSLAGSHLNLALRLLQQGATSPAGDVPALCQESLALQDVVMKGHK